MILVQEFRQLLFRFKPLSWYLVMWTGIVDFQLSLRSQSCDNQMLLWNLWFTTQDLCSSLRPGVLASGNSQSTQYSGDCVCAGSCLISTYAQGGRRQSRSMGEACSFASIGTTRQGRGTP